ncbi:unnamed protein product [Closterium sp. NIES-54]
MGSVTLVCTFPTYLRAKPRPAHPAPPAHTPRAQHTETMRTAHADLGGTCRAATAAPATYAAVEAATEAVAAVAAAAAAAVAASAVDDAVADAEASVA